MYNISLSLVNNYIEQYNYINNLLESNPNSNELKQVENRNLFISSETAKYLGFETYLFQDNINLELSKNLQNLFSINEPINITLINNHKKLNII